MVRFRKKALETSAFQWKGGGDLRELQAVFAVIKDGAVRIRAKRLIIEKEPPEGSKRKLKMEAEAGDWLVISDEGSVSILSEHDFANLYEPVEPPAQTEIEDHIAKDKEGDAKDGEGDAKDGESDDFKPPAFMANDATFAQANDGSGDAGDAPQEGGEPAQETEAQPEHGKKRGKK